ncbi:hypothetical protein C8R42DRAFT_727804 [Lentinula raphanica]|nr:hypothetical protein C8R42DRAFT_727804 [Lentinula raphanica]
MSGCNFHSEETGERCFCNKFEPDESGPKCDTCNHSQKIHSYETPKFSSQKKVATASHVKNLLQSLGRGRFEEANREANKNLVSKKSNASGSGSRSQSSSSISSKKDPSGSSDSFSVGRVLLLFTGLVHDDDDYLTLQDHIKLDEDLIIMLRDLGLAFKTNTDKDLFVFKKSWSTEQVEKKLCSIIGEPMQYLLDLADEEGARQWRLLQSERNRLRVSAESSPDGELLYDMKGTSGKSWHKSSVMIVSVRPLPVHIMKGLTRNWEHQAKRILRHMRWDDDISIMFPSTGKKRLRSPSPADSGDDSDQSTHTSLDNTPPPRKKLHRVAAAKAMTHIDLTQADNDNASQDGNHHNDDDGDYRPFEPSSPAMCVTSNPWDLDLTLDYIMI